MENGCQNGPADRVADRPRSTLFSTFSRHRFFNAFWSPLGSLLAPFWLPFGSRWLTFGSLWLTFGSLWLTFDSLWLPFGSLLVPFGSLLVPLGSLLLTLGLDFLTFGLSWRHFHNFYRFSLIFAPGGIAKARNIEKLPPEGYRKQ